MSEKIEKAYELTDGEKRTVSENFSKHQDWEKPVFAALKVNLIAHLRTQQDNKCCYCKYPLGFDIKEVDIEHIVPKSRFEQFTFESLNLALSCPGCNTKKSIKPVLLKEFVRYPRNTNHFRIVHSHYDTYSDHIEITNNCVFTAKTGKGSETITYCELFRLRTVEEKAAEFNNTSQSAISDLIKGLKDGDEKEKEEFFDLIKKAIR